MKPPLIAKIVVEHRFVRVRFGGDLLRARAGHSLRGEMPLGGVQNPPGRCRILYFSTSTGHVLLPRVCAQLRVFRVDLSDSLSKVFFN